MKEAKEYQDKICVNQNDQPVQSENDLKINKIGAIKPMIKYIKISVQLLKVFWLINFANLSFTLFGKKICSIEMIVKINEISIPASLFIISFITFIICRVKHYYVG